MDTFHKLRLKDNQLRALNTPLIGFGGKSVQPAGSIALPVTFGVFPRCVTTTLTFTVVKVKSPFNTLLRRPGINAVGGVPSAYYQKFKFLTPDGMALIGGDKVAARECYVETLKVGDEKAEVMEIVTELDQRDEIPIKIKPINELERVHLGGSDPERVTYVRAGLEPALEGRPHPPITEEY